MQITEFGTTALRVSSVALGAQLSADTGFPILDAYLEAGGNFLDTANVYGRWASEPGPWAELTLGKWLASRDVRDQVVIATKGGCYADLKNPGPGRLAPEEIRFDLTDSLLNLRTDHVDFYWLHHDDARRPVEEILDTMESLRAEGLLRHYGFSNWQPDREAEAVTAARTMGVAGFEAIQKLWTLAKPNHWRLIREGQHNVTRADIDIAARERLPIVAYSSQAQGWFGRPQTPDPTLREFLSAWYENPVNVCRREVVWRISREYGVDPSGLCVRALLSAPGQTIPIVGPKTVAQLRGSLSAIGTRLPREVLHRLREMLMDTGPFAGGGEDALP